MQTQCCQGGVDLLHVHTVLRPRDQALSLLWRHSSHPQTGIANMVLRSVIEWQMALALLGLLSLAYKI